MRCIDGKSFIFFEFYFLERIRDTVIRFCLVKGISINLYNMKISPKVEYINIIKEN